MADVSVEFGATDTGLQKTLETIQQQMSSLQGEVDSGTLSFQEINQKMRELRQAEGIFTKLGGEVSEATKSAKEFENQMRLAEAVTKSNRTALEIYSEEVDKLGKLLDSGLISQKTYAAAIEKAEAALKSATPQTEEARLANEALEASLKQAEAETKALAEEQRKAESITKSNRTATEIYNQEIEALQNHLSAGRISMETFERAVAKADAQLAAADTQVKTLGNEIENSGEKSQSAAGLFDASFQKIAAAFTIGNLAAEGFQKVVDFAFTAARAVVDAFGDALDLGGRLNDLTARTGETAGSLLILEQAFRDSGLSADQVGTAINKLQNFMADAAAGGDRQTQAMQRLGVTLADLSGKTPTEQMGIFADAINRIPDPTDRAAAASEVFGEKLGGRLLPLLKDFSPNLDAASDKVGSLAQIMDENAATFDKAGETIEAVQGKLAAFAAGILSQTIPAIEDLGTAMENVDAASLGETVGKVLAPPLKGVSQDIQTLNSLLDALGQAFRSIAEPLAGGARQFEELASKAGMTGKIIEALIPSSLNPLAIGANSAAAAVGSLAAKQEEATTEITNTGDAIVSTLPLVGEFNASLSDSEPSFAGVAEQTNLIGGDFDKISKKLNEEIIPATEKMQQLEGQRAEAEKERLARLEESKEKTREQYALELQIVEAKAAGDTELVKTLENQKLLNAEIQKAIDSGMGEKEAAAFAQQMVNAKNAAAAVKVDASTVSTAKNEAAGAATAAKSFATWLDYIKGIDASAPVKSLKEKTSDARKEIEAFGEYIGEDLKNKSFPDIAKKLGVKTIGLDGSEQVDAILAHIESKREGLIGLNPVDEKSGNASVEAIQAKIQQTLGATPQTLTLDASQSIEDIRGKLKENINLAFATGEGSKILGTIERAVEAIKIAVEKIEPRLPQQALA